MTAKNLKMLLVQCCFSSPLLKCWLEGPPEPLAGIHFWSFEAVGLPDPVLKY